MCVYVVCVCVCCVCVCVCVICVCVRGCNVCVLYLCMCVCARACVCRVCVCRPEFFFAGSLRTLGESCPRRPFVVLLGAVFLDRIAGWRACVCARACVRERVLT